MYNEEKVISKWVAYMYDQDETETEDFEYVLNIVGKEPKKILEIACGSGRMLVPFAQAGHTVVGLDFDECMLARIDDKAEGLKNLSYRKADVIAQEWGKDFDVVVIAANFLFNIVSEEGYREAQEMLIRKAASALAPKGHVFIDYGYTLYPEWWFGNPNERVIWEGVDDDGTYGKMMLADSTYDKTTGMNSFVRKFELKMTDGSEIKQEIKTLKHYPQVDEVTDWLAKYDFTVEKICGDYDGNPISEKTGRAIIWAKKN